MENLEHPCDQISEIFCFVDQKPSRTFIVAGPANFNANVSWFGEEQHYIRLERAGLEVCNGVYLKVRRKNDAWYYRRTKDAFGNDLMDDTGFQIKYIQIIFSEISKRNYLLHSDKFR